MKLFECQSCGHPLYFENTECERCHHQIGYLPDLEVVSAVGSTVPPPASSQEASEQARRGRRHCAKDQSGNCGRSPRDFRKARATLG